MVEEIQHAEELGFESVWLAEHHFTRFGIVPSALPLATYVAGQTKKFASGRSGNTRARRALKKLTADG